MVEQGVISMKKKVAQVAYLMLSVAAFSVGVGLLLMSAPRISIADTEECEEFCGGQEHPDCPDIPEDSKWLCCGDETKGSWYYNATAPAE
jgi:hypothetical protein